MSDKQELANQDRCYCCRYVWHQVKYYLLNNPQITTPAGTIQRGPLHTTGTTTNDIFSTAQSLKIIENISLTPTTEGSSATRMLDWSVELLLVSTKIAGNLTNTLVDYQTAEAYIIRSQFCTPHNLPLHLLQRRVTLQMTIQGSKCSIIYYTKLTIDWQEWSWACISMLQRAMIGMLSWIPPY